MTVIKSHRKDSAVGTIGPQAVKIDDSGAAPWIDHRASRVLAYGLAADLVCDDCGCLLDPPAHSPKCTA